MAAQIQSHERRAVSDLWALALRPGCIDESELWRALLDWERNGESDYRSRLLAHDALQALAARWGAEPLAHRLRSVQGGGRLEEAWHARFDEMGFASLQERIVQATTRETILQLLRELGSRMRAPARVHIGGSSSLLLADLIVRHTEDIDFVNELPEAIRSQPVLVDELARKYSLRLAHFASHYLPDGWESRARVLGSFGRLEALVVDPLDVLCGKLFSRRAKDFDDLRAAGPRIDQQAFRQRIRDTASNLRSDSSIAEQARQNWYILTGEASLP